MGNLDQQILEQVHFVFRRAFRRGRVRARDLESAFGCSLTTAERRIREALDTPSVDLQGLLIRDGRSWIILAPGAEQRVPAIAGEEDLLHHLGLQHDDQLLFRSTGLKAEELHLSRSPWLSNMPPQSGVLTTLIRALQADGRMGLEIAYVGLRRGDSINTGRQRVVPLSLQTIGEQFSVYVLQYAKYNAREKTWERSVGKPRTLVLSRIVEAVEDRSFQPRQHRLPYHFETTVTTTFRLNPALTDDQQRVLRHELNVQADGTVTLPESKMFQFQRLYSDFPASPDAVWPPLQRVARLA